VGGGEIVAKRYIPRWLYTEATVFGLDEEEYQEREPQYLDNLWIKIPPGTLRNDTIWPMQLEYLCVAGIPTTIPLPHLEGNPTPRALAGIGDRLFAEIGMTQEGDLNVVPAELNTVFSRTEKARLQSQRFNWGETCHFRHPYRLSRDSGFTVYYRRRMDLLVGPAGEDVIPADPGIPTAPSVAPFVGVLFRGVDVVTGKPVILGGNNENKPIGWFDEGTFDSADLLNNGRHDVDIYSVTVNNHGGSYNTDPAVYCAASGVHEGYLINPIVGERWMPGSTEVPIGCMAPLSSEGFMVGRAAATAGYQFRRDLGPHTFWFAPNTYLHRRQEIALKLGQHPLPFNQPISIALFGYLEVE
jgi:hypothetical protein